VNVYRPNVWVERAYNWEPQHFLGVPKTVGGNYTDPFWELVKPCDHIHPRHHYFRDESGLDVDVTEMTL